MQIDFRGYTFELSGGSEELLKEVKETSLMQNWLNSLHPSIIVKTIELQTTMRDEKGRLKYIKISTVSERNGGIIPRIIILDGRSIGVIVVINKEYVILLRRPRIATGEYRYEIANINTDGRPVTAELACEFAKQAYGVESDPSKFVDLLKETLGSSDEGIHPYCGPCDRQAFYYLLDIEMSQEEIDALDGKIVGDNTSLKIVKIPEVGRTVNDFITMAGMLFYKKYIQAAFP